MVLEGYKQAGYIIILEEIIFYGSCPSFQEGATDD